MICYECRDAADHGRYELHLACAGSMGCTCQHRRTLNTPPDVTIRPESEDDDYHGDDAE